MVIKSLTGREHGRYFSVMSALCMALLLSVAAHSAQAAPWPKSPSIEAKSWAMLDARSGQIIAEHNADEQLPPASLTKMVTLYLAFEAIKKGRLDPEATVSVSKKAWKIGGSTMFLEPRMHPQLHSDAFELENLELTLGNDGFDHDMLRQTHIVSGLFKDQRQDARLFPAEQTLEMLTCNAAVGLGLEQEIGSLEAGKKADFVCHDTDRPEWQPLQGIVNQLAWLADGRSVHSVWVDGVQVVDNYRSTLIDEDALYAKAQQASREIFERTGLPFKSPWPVA